MKKQRLREVNLPEITELINDLNVDSRILEPITFTNRLLERADFWLKYKH